MPSYTAVRLLERICDKLEIEYGGLKAAALHKPPSKLLLNKQNASKQTRPKTRQVGLFKEERAEHFAELQELLAKPLRKKSKTQCAA